LAIADKFFTKKCKEHIITIKIANDIKSNRKNEQAAKMLMENNK